MTEYERGQKAAWSLLIDVVSLSAAEKTEIFGIGRTSSESIFSYFTMEEITERMKGHRKSFLHVGDQVKYKNSQSRPFFVTAVTEDGLFFEGIDEYGNVYSDCTASLTEKTGKKSPAIRRALEQMQSMNDT